MSARRVILLAPQRDVQTVAAAVADLGVEGDVATITAGWEEREGEDAELSEHLGGRTRNLGLYPRSEAVFSEDVELRGIHFEHQDRLRALRALYRLRLAPQLHACRALIAGTDPAAPDELHAPEIDDSVAAIRTLDAHHLARVAALDAEFAERVGGAARPSIARQREELAQVLGEVGAVLVAGGHVGTLRESLRLFDLFGLAGELPVVAWSGGAMVLAERVVLFHDSPPQGAGDPEVYAPGLGLARGVVPLPHARHRLRLDDPARVALFARRFAPDKCAALDGGERLDGEAGGTAWVARAPTRVLRGDGSVAEERAA